MKKLLLVAVLALALAPGAGAKEITGLFDWPLVSGALLPALALGLTALLLARRSRRPRAATA